MPDAATSPALADGASATSTATSTSTLTDSGTNPSSDSGLPPGTLFVDEFDNGYSNWVDEVVNGAADPVPTSMLDATGNGWITLDATSSPSTFARIHSIPQFTNSDISASVKFRIVQAPASTRLVRLDVRQSSATPNVFYAVGATVNANDGSVTKISLFKKVLDTNATTVNYTICALPDPTPYTFNPVPLGQSLIIKITISGAGPVNLSAYYVDPVVGQAFPMGSYVDDCSSALQPTGSGTAPVLNGGCLAGQTGLGIQVEKGIVASFDNVLVTSP
jgi:hypothetical protein